MKKATLLLVFILVIIGAFSRAPVSPNSEMNWSVIVSTGINLFDGDISQTSNRFLPASLLGAVEGLGVNYQITNRYGLSLDYNLMPIAADTKGWKIRTLINTMTLNVTVNLTDVLFPQSYSFSKYDFNLYGSIGLGAACYYYHAKPAEIIMSPKYGLATTMPISLYGIYDCSEYISIGAKITYWSFNKDNLEGVQSLNYKGSYNDYIDAFTVFLKYRF